jgi:predicted MFS family arabinose efflux permease
MSHGDNRVSVEKTERKIVFITCFGHCLCHIYVLILAGALLPIAESLGLSITKTATIGTLCYLLFGLGSLPSGIFATKTNAKFTLKIFFVGSALAALLTSISNTTFAFAAGLALMGVFGSLYHVSGLTLISQGIRRRGRVLGIHGIAGSAGIAMAPVITGVITSFLGWQKVYLIMSGVGVIGYLFLAFDQDIPESQAESHDEHQAEGGKSATLLFFVLALVPMAINGFVYRGFLTTLPTYVSQEISIMNTSSVVSGGIVSTLILSVGMIGQYLGGYLSDKTKMTRLYLLIMAMTLPFVVLIGLTDSFLLVTVAIVFALLHFSTQPLENHIISVFTPPRLVSSAYGVKFVAAFGLGSFAAAFSGYIIDHFDIFYVFPALGAVLLISIVPVSALAWIDR